MPYNPGVQDMSGQILAQGMMARTQGITSAIKDFAKNEDERQKTMAAVKGMLMDPYYQQQLSTDPGLLATAEKVKSGNARLGDVQAFLGTLTAMEHGRQEDMKRQQAEVQKQYTDALREQSIAQMASIDTATKIKAAQDQQALANAGFIKEALRNKAPDATSLQVLQDYLVRGGTPTEEAVRMFGGMMAAEGQMGATEQRARAAEARAESTALAAQRREAEQQAKLDLAQSRFEQAGPEASYLRSLEAAVKNEVITREEANQMQKDYLRSRSQQGMNPLASLLGGGMGGAPIPGMPVGVPTAATATPTQAKGPQLMGANNAASPVRVTSKAEYDQLPPGTWYVDPQGNVSYKR